MSDSIPQDVLIEILLKLPVKSIIRCLSVCKAWKSLIKSPLFASLDLTNAQNHLLVRASNFPINRYHHHYCLFTKTEPLSIKWLEFPFDDTTNGTNYSVRVHVHGSCNGLLCFSVQSFSYGKLPHHAEYKPPLFLYTIIWNPCIKNHVVLPQPTATNPSEINRVVLGFGIASNVYKVVRLVYNIELKPRSILGSRAEIFTLGTTSSSWRKLSNFGIDIVPRAPRDYCWFFKGFIHWITFECLDTHVYRYSILTFHVGDEVFGEIKLPELNMGTVQSLAVIGESFGLLHYGTELEVEVGRRWCDVWIMKDYGVTESWTKLYRIDGPGVRDVVGFLGKNESVLLSRKKFGFDIYNAETRESKHVGNFGVGVGGGTYSMYVDEFKESLALLGG